MTPAILLLVVQMLNAEMESVHACQNIREILTMGVDQNVYLIRIAQEIKLA